MLGVKGTLGEITHLVSWVQRQEKMKEGYCTGVDLSKQMHSAPDHPKAKFRKSAVGGCSWKLHVNIKNRSNTFTVLKGEKYKRPLLMRQENHRLKMLTVTFQKAPSLSNSKNTRRGRKKDYRTLRKRKMIKCLFSLRTLSCKVTSVHVS